MALTIRSNGAAINSTWFNDIRDLLTGAMQDQIVTIKNELVLSAIGAAPSSPCGGSLVAATNLGIGLYKYVYTYANQYGETAISPVFSITTTTGNQKVSLTSITTGPTGTTRRNIYRTAVGGGGTPPLYKLMGTISNNIATTFTDTVADGSLGVAFPNAPSFGGSLSILDANSTLRNVLNSDGSIEQSMAGITVNGNVGGSATLYQPFQGPSFKAVIVNLNAWQSNVNVPVTLPTPFTNNLFGIAGVIGIAPDGGLGLVGRGGAVNARIFTALGASGGSSSPQSIIPSASIFYVGNGGNDLTDQVNMLANTGPHTASMWLIGN